VRAHGIETTLELLEAIRTYEAQREGRGERFLAHVDATFGRIRSAPLSFQRVPFVRRPVMRRAKVLRFPYSVFYYVLRGEPIVVAIVHGKRQP
jgi:plasmid stabilization system protein ParE